MKKTKYLCYAEFSEDRIYRYFLRRTWEVSKPFAMFIGLNPSTADECTDDPTIRRCIGFAKSWGYGGLCMANLFAYRATRPKLMKATQNPIGDENDTWLKGLSKNAGVVVAAWGNDGQYMDRSKTVKEMIPCLHYLKLNKSGEPAHPLYQKGDLVPITYRPKPEYDNEGFALNSNSVTYSGKESAKRLTDEEMQEHIQGPKQMDSDPKLIREAMNGMASRDFDYLK